MDSELMQATQSSSPDKTALPGSSRKPSTALDVQMKTIEMQDIEDFEEAHENLTEIRRVHEKEKVWLETFVSMVSSEHKYSQHITDMKKEYESMNSDVTAIEKWWIPDIQKAQKAARQLDYKSTQSFKQMKLIQKKFPTEETETDEIMQEQASFCDVIVDGLNHLSQTVKEFSTILSRLGTRKNSLHELSQQTLLPAKKTEGRVMQDSDVQVSLPAEKINPLDPLQSKEVVEEESVSTISTENKNSAHNTSFDPVRLQGHSVRKNDLTVIEEPLEPTFPSYSQLLFESVKTFKIGGLEFMEQFKKYEHLLERKDKLHRKLFETGSSFKRCIGELPLETVCLVLKNYALGMQSPSKMTFDNILEFLENIKDDHFSVINSVEQKHLDEKMSLVEIIEEFKRPNRDPERVLNLLSMEFSSLTNNLLSKKFHLPKLVETRCIVYKLQEVLKNKRTELNKLAETASGTDKNEYRKESRIISKYLAKIPQYHKYFLLTMANSFTNVHMDFSGTLVYYHVIEGRKIFYFAKPTKRNIEIYKKHEGSNLENWIAEELDGEWQRVVIEKGQTAFIPSGFLHMVFTPVDSIVIGGNYLTAADMEMQIEITRLEEEAQRKQAGDMEKKTQRKKKRRENEASEDIYFQGFWDVLFCYLEFVFCPLIKNSPGTCTMEDINLAKILLKELSVSQKTVWYESENKKTTLAEFEKLCTEEFLQGDETTRKRAFTTSPVQSTSEQTTPKKSKK